MSEVLLHHSIESFATWLRVERNLAPRTRTAYVYDLSRFLDWCQEVKSTENVSLKSLTSDDLHSYLQNLREKHQFKSPTMNRVLASLRGFFAYCVREDMCKENPVARCSRPKLEQKIPVYLIQDELRKLLSAPDQHTSKGLRDYTIMVCLAFGGLRVSELVGLNIEDFDFNRKTMRVFGKGRKERLVPVHEELEKAVMNMLQDEERVPAGSEKGLFLNAKGKRLSVRAVQYLIDEYVAIAGLTKEHISPHKLRHTFATLLHSQDVDLIDIQALMGHASLVSTQIYTHTDTRRLKQTVELLDFEPKPDKTGSDH